MPANKQLFWVIEVIDEAISKGKQVSFTYNEYGTDKKLHPRLDSEGNVREYIINPYQIVATNGRYYLICNYDKYDDVSNYRLDLITDIKLLDTPVNPMKKIKGLERGFNLPKHMAEHIYMFAGESVPVKFRADSDLAGQIIDWFGTDAKFIDDNGETVEVRVTANEQAMKYWALQYGQYVDILEPKHLRDSVKAAAWEIIADKEDTLVIDF